MPDSILIVGAGPTGLTLASELLRHGIACRIIEKELAASPFTKALAVQARTLELFENLGIAQRCVDTGLKLRAFNVFDRGTHTVRMDFAGLDSKFPFILSLPQSETERILSENFTAMGGVIERGVTLSGVTQDSQGVTAQLSHPNGRNEEYRCHWLAGCDGAHSAVRHLSGMTFRGAKYPEYYVLADVEAETRLDTSEFYIFSNGADLAGFHPFSKTGARIFADIDLPKSERDHPHVTLERLQHYLDQRSPKGMIRLTKLNWESTFFVHKRQVDSYRKGRIFLAGDAAHVHNPAGGLGMNMGIQDAFNLAWKLALAARGEAAPGLLDSYSAERYAVGKDTLRMTDFFQHINTVRDPILQIIRGSLGPWLSRNPLIRHRYRRAVTQISLHYRKSAIVSEDARFGAFPNGPRPGERAPEGALFDPRGNTVVSVMEFLKTPKHLLLLFAGSNAPSSKVKILRKILHDTRVNYAGHMTPVFIATPGTEIRLDDAHYEDRNFSLHHEYGGIHSPSLYLIRPDGYIAYRSMPVDQKKITDYLRRIFL